MRKTKVRIVGDPELAGKVADVIMEHFEVAAIRRFNKPPTRYSRSNSPGVSIYIDVKKPREV